MAFRGKTYRAAAEKRDADKHYPVADVFELVKATKRAKFDEMVDVAVKLGVDPKHSDQMVRGAVSLPNGTGKTVRVVVFAKGEKEVEATKAGADHVGGEELVGKIEKDGWLEFDVVIATPDMMRVVSKVGKILGPRGLMPNPKTGTVTFEVGQAVKEAKAGRIEYRVEKAGIVHALIGRSSFAAAKLQENFLVLMTALSKAKPSSSKGNYFRSISVSTTMGPAVKVDPADVGKLLG